MDTALRTKGFKSMAGTDARLNARILIVGDIPSSLKPASDALEMNGYIVEQASDERQVQVILGRTIPNLILLNFALPGVDRLARQLRTDGKLKHVPIVAVVTRSAANGGDGAHEAGCDGCIIGPVDTRKLPLQIAAFLVRGASASQRLSATSVA